MVVVLQFYNGFFGDMGLHCHVNHNREVLDHNINLVVELSISYMMEQINRKIFVDAYFVTHAHAFSKILNIFDIITKELTKLKFSTFMLLLSKLFRLMLSKLTLLQLSKLIQFSKLILIQPT